MGLHRSVAGRRADRIFQRQEQGVAHHVVGVRRHPDPDDVAQCVSAKFRAEILVATVVVLALLNLVK